MKARVMVDEIRDKRHAAWFWMDNTVLDTHCRTIGAYGVTVYALLARHANAEGKAFPSIQAMVKTLGISRQTITKTLEELIKAKLISKELRKSDFGDYTTNVYTLLHLSVGTSPDYVPTLPHYVPTSPDGGQVRNHVTYGTSPDRPKPDLLKQDLREEKTHPISFPAGRTGDGEQWHEVLTKVLKTIPHEYASTALAFHHRISEALHGVGYDNVREWAVPERGDGRTGKIDILVTSPRCIGIEIDRAMPREKSIEKLQHIDGLKVIILRETSEIFPTPAGLDALLSYPHAPTNHGSPRRIKTYFPTDPPAQEALKAAILDTALDTWITSKGLHVDLDAQWDAFTGKALANGYRYIDWRRAFMNWLTSPYQHAHQGRPRGGLQDPDGFLKYVTPEGKPRYDR